MRNDSPLFTKDDYGVVRSAVSELPETERAIVQMRFWGNSTIEEIGRVLDLSWNEVDLLLSDALGRIRKACLSDSEFSRSAVMAVAA